MTEAFQIFTPILNILILGVLAFITYLYMKETRLLRKRAQHPDFSLHPDSFTIGSSVPNSLNLVNSGEVANDISIDCSWGNSKTLFLYLFSLTTGSRGHLAGLPINQIINENQQLRVKITCKDASAQPYKAELSLDFARFKQQNRVLAYQFDSTYALTEELRDIRRELERLASHR